MSESSEPLMTGRGVEQAIQAALDVIQVESRINVILKSSDGQEAAEDVERNWHKRVLAIKYLQLKEELEAGQPSKGGDKYSAKPSKGSGKGCAKPSEGRRNDRAKLLKQLKQDWCDHYGGDATESDAETDMQQARNLCLDATEIDLMISGKQGEITPTMAMQNTCFTEHRHGQPSTRLTVEALRKLLQGRLDEGPDCGKDKSWHWNLGSSRVSDKVIRAEIFSGSTPSGDDVESQEGTRLGHFDLDLCPLKGNSVDQPQKIESFIFIPAEEKAWDPAKFRSWRLMLLVSWDRVRGVSAAVKPCQELAGAFDPRGPKELAILSPYGTQ
ncbi:hypothetical protein AK812_SmicGene15135 [Symbiodinium microadriaticum]|uniref:Uncharacterized protein n=1 Tax=Symbiodinium microadriaticum TaxID=2951 RepID=A0A1Q9E3R2_SYMMI|nr:hypothetical protein AK812_SmicGene15135 [Symbiodinium microadriaticum]